MTRSVRILFSFALAALAAPAQTAGPASSNSLTALRVEHRLSSLDTDGIQRDVRFVEYVYRQGDRVQIARELPPTSAHAEHDHANPHAGHKHADIDIAPRWIERNARGALTVCVASASQQENYAVEPAEYPNIGFDGSQATAYHLLDPAALKGMCAEGPVRDGVQTYCSMQGERTVTVDWDVTGQYPRRVESHSATGIQRKLMRVTALPASAVAPWERAQRCTTVDYTDLMDRSAAACSSSDRALRSSLKIRRPILRPWHVRLKLSHSMV